MAHGPTHNPLRLLFKDIPDTSQMTEQQRTEGPNNRPNEWIELAVEGDDPFVIIIYNTLEIGVDEGAMSEEVAHYDGDDWIINTDTYKDKGLERGMKFSDIEICSDR